MKHNTRKFLLSGLVVLTFIAYSYQQRHDDEAAKVIVPTSQATSSSVNPASTQSTIGSAAPSGMHGMMSAAYKDGSYVGNSADAFYGYIQVKAVIQNGAITDVQFLQHPNDRSTSIEINNQAMPYLKQEAIKAQNSQVDIVSGATDTSYAFIESLKTALNKART